MSKKVRIFRILLSLILMSFMIFSMSACSTVSEKIGEIKGDGISVEEGWTIHEDGSFVYAAVLENTTEDKILKSGVIHVKALDEEGNDICVSDLDPGIKYFGNLHPGEKTAVIVDSYNNDGTLFSGIPVKFEYYIYETKWEKESELPYISVEDAERFSTNGYTNNYSFTINNSSDIDFDWKKIKDEQNINTLNCYICEIIRNDEGKIVGGSELYNYIYEEETGYPVIGAGEETSTEAGGSLENSLFESNENYELYVRWTP